MGAKRNGPRFPCPWTAGNWGRPCGAGEALTPAGTPAGQCAKRTGRMRAACGWEPPPGGGRTGRQAAGRRRGAPGMGWAGGENKRASAPCAKRTDKDGQPLREAH